MNEKVKAIISRFRDGDTIILSPEDERVLLEAIGDCDFINAGTSRAVYALGDKYVLKLAMSHGGINQNYIEYRYFQEVGNNLLASLYAHGTIINIMERVHKCNYFCEWDWEEDEQDIVDEINTLIEDVNDLTEYYGGDNKQVGYSDRVGGWVVYDYGYGLEDEYSHNEIVDNVSYWMDATNPIENGLNIIDTGIIPSYQELQDAANYFYDERNEMEEYCREYEEDYDEEE